MLMLRVKNKDYIMIDGKIKVSFFTDAPAMRIGIDAPREVNIVRGDVYERSHEIELYGKEVADIEDL